MAGEAPSSIILSPNGTPARSLFTGSAKAQKGAATTSFPVFHFGQNSWFGAQTSDARGQLILPPVRAEDALRATERTILALKSRLLAENYGPGGALWNLASLIGYLKPQSVCDDKEWAEQAEVYFNRVTQSPLTFDAGGRFTLATYQIMSTYRRMLDGDAFTVLTTSQSGHARVMGYEGLCVQTGDKQEPPVWVDGVKCDPLTRFPLAYSFAERDAKGKPVFRVIDASKVIHHQTQKTFAGRRGVPALAHAINDFHDTIETKSFQKQMLKVAALVGITRANDPAANTVPFNLGVSGPLQQSIYTPPTATETTSTLPQPKMKFEEAVEGGLVSAAPFKVVHDERPHPNGEEFKRSLLRECAIGLGFPPQLLFFMDDPGGAYTRVLLEMAARAIVDHHVNHLAPMVRRIWAYTIALGIKKGDLPPPKSETWVKIRLTPPRMPTADLGRMGRLTIDLRKACLTTYLQHYEEQGLEYEEQLRQCAREARMLLDLEAEFDLPPGTMSGALLQQGQSPDMLGGDEKKDDEAKK